eukprot:TRINITY_DN8588_c0_g1_i2.p1 TRINITY_DN8588_c0_g1~~TRINITY_DN8588_c0_g1_i2.p1  ORF type:complete len:116 (+),score=35.73 TRINITY_DN8588_c0_g1_i2:238-585(+)
MASYPDAQIGGMGASHSNNLYASIMSKYNRSGGMDNQNRVEVVSPDCDDIEAVRKLTDRCVMAVRGKYRGRSGYIVGCLLYTSDAADDLLCVDLGGRRIIKKKKHNIKHQHTTRR